MSYTINNNTISITKNNDNIYLILNNIYESNITIDDISNNMTFDKFHIFIIKCLEKQDHYNIQINNDNGNN